MNNTHFKQSVFKECLAILHQKTAECNSALKELSEGIEREDKSSAGDKYETARAMMQLEQEKIHKRLSDISIQLEALQQININYQSSTVIKGSLIKTDKGFIFLSVPIGKLKVDNEEVFVVSPLSPIGKRLLGTHKNQIIEVNNIRYLIEEVFS